MYSLLRGFYDYFTLKEEYSIIIIGLDNAGKTTLLERIKSIYTSMIPLPPERITPTIGLNVAKFVHRGVFLKFWDLGGQSELQIIWEKYFPACHGVLFVVDSTDGDRILDAQQTLSKVIQHADLCQDVPVLMLANKRDCPESLPLEDIKTLFNPLAMHMDASDATVLPISALDGIGVKEAIEWILLRITRNKTVRQPNYANR